MSFPEASEVSFISYLLKNFRRQVSVDRGAGRKACVFD